jgi:hypothetical protein
LISTTGDVADSGQFQVGIGDSPDFNSTPALQVNQSIGHWQSLLQNANGDDAPVIDAGTDTQVIFVGTIVPAGGECAQSAAGSSIETVAGSDPEAPFNCVFIEGSDGSVPTYVRLIAVYSPQPEADLPTMSAGSEPVPPEGFAFWRNADGDLYVDADGKYWIREL